MRKECTRCCVHRNDFIHIIIKKFEIKNVDVFKHTRHAWDDNICNDRRKAQAPGTELLALSSSGRR